jgi:cytochrome c-type biogenesis protein CcmF
VNNTRSLSGLWLVIGIVVVPAFLMFGGTLNPGQALNWISFLAALTAGLLFLAAVGGREAAWGPAKLAYRLQWLSYLAAAVWLWHILFTHQFKYQYVASYSSLSMPPQYIYAAFWGGQEGTFMLWAFLTCTLGLVLMRVKHDLVQPAMMFLNLPLILLGLVTVMRGPFLMFAAGHVPPDGNGLNPLLQDPWMTIHPPTLFTGFSSLAVPFAIAMAALVRRNYDGWIKLALPWVVLSTAVLSMGFIMGGVWAYKVLGWGGYWGWDPVENGSLIPWLCNAALLHGLLVQRVNGSLRRTNLFLAVTSYVLVLYASFLTRSGVLADFSVHSFVNLGLNGFLLSFLGCTAVLGYGFVIYRLRDIPGPKNQLGNLSRESMMWLGQLVLLLMCALTAVGMSAPLITRLFGPPSNVQTSYYNLVNAPLAVALGLLMGLGPLMRWREQDGKAFMRTALPSVVVALLVTMGAMLAGVRGILPTLVVFGAGFALAANVIVTVRGFRAGWKHGIAFLGHTGVAVLLVGVVASSGYGRSAQMQLPQGQERSALGYHLTYQGVLHESDGHDRVVIAVNAPEGHFQAAPRLYWSEFNQGYMKKPHIERFLTHDVYISPLEMVGEDQQETGTWFSKGERKQVGQVYYTFKGFDIQNMGTPQMSIAAQVEVEMGGRTVHARPKIEMASGGLSHMPDYLPGGGSIELAAADPNTGKASLVLPGGAGAAKSNEHVLAIELSTKPLINLVWLGAILMVGSVFMSVGRRALDLRRP